MATLHDIWANWMTDKSELLFKAGNLPMMATALLITYSALANEYYYLVNQLGRGNK